MKLKEQLEAAFFNKEIRVNQLAKHIIIKVCCAVFMGGRSISLLTISQGECKLEVKQFLKERHF